MRREDSCSSLCWWWRATRPSQRLGDAIRACVDSAPLASAMRVASARVGRKSTAARQEQWPLGSTVRCKWEAFLYTVKYCSHGRDSVVLLATRRRRDSIRPRSGMGVPCGDARLASSPHRACREKKQVWRACYRHSLQGSIWASSIAPPAARITKIADTDDSQWRCAQ